MGLKRNTRTKKSFMQLFIHFWNNKYHLTPTPVEKNAIGPFYIIIFHIYCSQKVIFLFWISIVLALSVPGEGVRIVFTKLDIYVFMWAFAITWCPSSVVHWLFTFWSSPRQRLSQMKWNLVGSIYGRSSLKIAHFVPIHLQTWSPWAILVSDWPIFLNLLLWNR